MYFKPTFNFSTRFGYYAEIQKKVENEINNQVINDYKIIGKFIVKYKNIIPKKIIKFIVRKYEIEHTSDNKIFIINKKRNKKIYVCKNEPETFIKF